MGGTMQYRIEDPTEEDRYALYGFDHVCLFFVEVYEKQRSRPKFSYDAQQRNYNHESSLLGALQFMVEHRFISEDDLDGALVEYRSPEGDGEDLSPSEKRALEVLENFKRAAD